MRATVSLFFTGLGFKRKVNFMAVLTRPFGVIRSAAINCSHTGASQNGWTVRRTINTINTQICTVAVSLSLFNTVRLPREAIKYGEITYLMVYSFWLLVVGVCTAVLQLSMGQLSQQDPIGIWRAVPILRGVGHLRILTSYLCCAYSMVYVALSAAYIIWIGKGSFPLRDCVKLHITPNGYENKMNASECFNSTFLAPFTEQPQYLGIMAILIFVLWFFVPIMLLYLQKSLKSSIVVLTPIILIMTAILCIFISNPENITSILESDHWKPLSEPYIWHSALVQALLSTHIVSGYLVSTGGTLYKHSDVRWTSTFVIITNFLSGWFWVFLWQSIYSGGHDDTSLIAILVLIYQSSVLDKRSKEWPLLGFAIIFASGIITLLTLAFPIYHKLHRLAGDNWRIFAAATSALGTAITVAIIAQGLNVATTLDELVIPILAIFTTVVEVVGFVFIYGFFYLSVDIYFITGNKLPWFWLLMWWLTPMFLMGVTGWWLRTLLRATWGQGQTLWPLGGVLLAILVIMIILAGIAVAKEEQFNLCSKITAAFRPSRLWGPEEPMSRYIWMSQRSLNEPSEYDFNVDTSTFNNIVNKYHVKNREIGHNWLQQENIYQNSSKSNTKSDLVRKRSYADSEAIYAVPVNYMIEKYPENHYNSICISKGELGGPTNCYCSRHFQLKVPDLRNSEITTSL